MFGAMRACATAAHPIAALAALTLGTKVLVTPLVAHAQPNLEGAPPVAQAPAAATAEREPPSIRFEPGKGLIVQSADGDFKLATRIWSQLQYRLEDTAGTDLEHSLSFRRARLMLAGNAFGEHNKFSLQLGFAPQEVGTRDGVTTTSPILDLYWDFTYIPEANLRIGQYRVPFTRQWINSITAQQLVDRSIVTDEFGFNRDIGVDVRSKNIGGFFRYTLGAFFGEGQNSFESENLGMVYLARAEFLPLGMFADHIESDLDRGKPRLSLGLGYAYMDRATANRGIFGPPPADGGTTDIQVATADATFKAFGFSLIGEAVVRDGSRNPGNAVDDAGVPIPLEESRDGFGGLIQAGYVIPPVPFEVAGRFATIVGDDDGSLSDFSEVGGGVSYYFFGHAFKLQADYFRQWGDDISTGDDRVRVQLSAGL